MGPNETRTYRSWLDTRRGLHPGCRRQDVHYRRPGDCIWRFCKCGVWLDLLDNNIILIVGEAFRLPFFVLQVALQIAAGKGEMVELFCSCVNKSIGHIPIFENGAFFDNADFDGVAA